MAKKSRANRVKTTLPPGCRRCLGRPFVTTPMGADRCTCERGRWFREQDRKRRAAA